MNSTTDPLADVPLSVIGGTLQLLRYVSIVSPVVATYDCLLTLDDEIRYIWPGSLTLPKALYYINRYLTIIMTSYSNYQISGFHPPLSDLLFVPYFVFVAFLCANTCQFWLWSTSITNLVRLSVATALLCLRVAALYKGVRWVTWTLWIGFVLSQVLRAAASLLGTTILFGHMGYSDIGHQCLPRSSAKGAITSPATAVVIAVAPTILDTFILTLTIVKAMRSNALSGSHPSSSIMRTLLTHELLYFIIIGIMRIFASVVSIGFSPALVNAVPTVEWGVESALISRFFLHLRSVYHERQIFGQSETTVAFSHHRPSTLWTRGNQLSTGFVGLGAQESTYSRFAAQHDRGMPLEKAVDLGASIELQTRRDEDQNHVEFAAGIAPSR